LYFLGFEEFSMAGTCSHVLLLVLEEGSLREFALFEDELAGRLEGVFAEEGILFV
jgi:hypothetical protein